MTYLSRVCYRILIVSCLIYAGSIGFVLYSFPALTVLAFVLLMACRVRNRPFGGWSHGTAHLASFDTVARNGLLSRDGPILGRAGLLSPVSRFQAVVGLFRVGKQPHAAVKTFLSAWFRREIQQDQMIRAREHVHLCTIAPTGAGKGTKVIIVNLRAYRKSVVVFDNKGETYAETAAHRRRCFGHRIVRYDPYCINGPGGDCINPFDFVDEHALDFVEQCRDLAHMIVQREANDPQPHWPESAIKILTAAIAFVCSCESDRRKRNIQSVCNALSSPDTFEQMIKLMMTVTDFGGVIAQMGAELLWYQGKERGSVLTTLHRHISLFMTPAITACTSTSTFHPRELRNNIADAYICIPSERLESVAPLTRMILGTIIRVVSRGANESNPVLFFIDECAHLGKMQVIEEAVTLLRGHGIRLWLFFQSIDQINKCLGDRANTILDNIGTQQYFGLMSFDSCDNLSKRIGDSTILVESLNKTVSQSRPTGSDGKTPGSVSHSTSVTTSETGRRVLKTEEILRLPADVGLVFHRNLPAIPVNLLAFYDAPEFANGRTGEPLGLGRRALGLSLMFFLVSLVCLATALELPSMMNTPVRVRRPVFHEAYDPPDSPAGYPVPYSRPVPSNGRTSSRKTMVKPRQGSFGSQFR